MDSLRFLIEENAKIIVKLHAILILGIAVLLIVFYMFLNSVFFLLGIDFLTSFFDPVYIILSGLFIGIHFYGLEYTYKDNFFFRRAQGMSQIINGLLTSVVVFALLTVFYKSMIYFIDISNLRETHVLERLFGTLSPLIILIYGYIGLSKPIERLFNRLVFVSRHSINEELLKRFFSYLIERSDVFREFLEYNNHISLVYNIKIHKDQDFPERNIHLIFDSRSGSDGENNLKDLIDHNNAIIKSLFLFCVIKPEKDRIHDYVSYDYDGRYKLTQIEKVIAEDVIDLMEKKF